MVLLLVLQKWSCLHHWQQYTGHMWAMQTLVCHQQELAVPRWQQTSAGVPPTAHWLASDWLLQQTTVANTSHTHTHTCTHDTNTSPPSPPLTLPYLTLPYIKLHFYLTLPYLTLHYVTTPSYKQSTNEKVLGGDANTVLAVVRQSQKFCPPQPLPEGVWDGQNLISWRW